MTVGCDTQVNRKPCGLAAVFRCESCESPSCMSHIGRRRTDAQDNLVGGLCRGCAHEEQLRAQSDRSLREGERARLEALPLEELAAEVARLALPSRLRIEARDGYREKQWDTDICVWGIGHVNSDRVSTDLAMLPDGSVFSCGFSADGVAIASLSFRGLWRAFRPPLDRLIIKEASAGRRLIVDYLFKAGR